MGQGAKSKKGAQRRYLCLSGPYPKLPVSKYWQRGTDTGQVSK